MFKKIKKLLVETLVFLMIITPAIAAIDSHHVTQGGAGAYTGVDWSNAFSIAQFNSSGNWDTDIADDNKIGPGDYVYFQGTFSTQIKTPQNMGGSSGYPITLDGWKDGTCNQVANLGCSNDAKFDLGRSDSTSNIGIYIPGGSYIIIQDFEVDDSFGGFLAVGPSSGGSGTHLTLRRVHMHNLEATAWNFSANPSNGYVGHHYVTVGGALGDGNYIYSVKEECLTQDPCEGHDSKADHGDDLVVSYNYNTRPSEDQDGGDGSNILAIHTGDRVLVEYNTFEYPHGQAVIALKEQNGQDKIVRFNKLRGSGESGCVGVSGKASQPNKNFAIYCNLMYDTDTGVRTYKDYENIRIWSNLIHNVNLLPTEDKAHGYYTIEDSDNQSTGPVYFYNNTVARVDMDGDCGSNSGGLYIYPDENYAFYGKNNIFVDNLRDYNGNQIYVETGGEWGIPDLDYNLYYVAGGTPYIRWSSSSRTLSWMVSNTSHCDNYLIGDPKFADANGADNIHGTADDDYRLASDSPARGTGDDLSSCWNITVQGTVYNLCYQTGLDEDTDWTTIPPTVLTATRSTWDRGAYVYGSGGGTPPSSPSGLVIINNQ